MESVTELARKYSDSSLVRQNIKVFNHTADKSSPSSEITSHITERSRTLTSGELLVLVDEVDPRTVAALPAMPGL